MAKSKIPRMKARVVPQGSPQLLDRMRAEIRVHHYSLRTGKACVDWARRLLEATSGTMGLIVALLCGTGVRLLESLRLLEGLRLRVKDVATTMIRTHGPNRGERGVASPLDRWFLPAPRPLHRCPRRSPT